MKILTVFGTRPEAIKMCPLLKVLQQREEIDSIVCVTAQHREMLDQILHVFQIIPDYDLNIMREQQTLTSITIDILNGMEAIIQKEEPDLVLVHGDTATSFVTALAAFYQKVPVGHVEAGLRSFSKYSPFPEEMNRCLTARIAELHFAPTEQNRRNLEQEGITEHVFVTGNTVIDSFKTTIQHTYKYSEDNLNRIYHSEGRIILVTAHRRENWGRPLRNICHAIKKIVDEFTDVQIVYPVHYNPVVRNCVYEILGGKRRINLFNPIDVVDMHNAINNSYLILSDSGGIQEEASTLGIPVVLLRKETERMEAVNAGVIIKAGIEEDNIVECTRKLLSSPDYYQSVAVKTCLYGSGDSSQQIVNHIWDWNLERIRREGRL